MIFNEWPDLTNTETIILSVLFVSVIFLLFFTDKKPRDYEYD